eukprot:ANDGO_05948.mRNA.1 putative serine/threonine-protein kinase DDB_G0272282
MKSAKVSFAPLSIDTLDPASADPPHPANVESPMFTNSPLARTTSNIEYTTDYPISGSGVNGVASSSTSALASTSTTSRYSGLAFTPTAASGTSLRFTKIGSSPMFRNYRPSENMKERLYWAKRHVDEDLRSLQLEMNADQIVRHHLSVTLFDSVQDLIGRVLSMSDADLLTGSYREISQQLLSMEESAKSSVDMRVVHRLMIIFSRCTRVLITLEGIRTITETGGSGSPSLSVRHSGTSTPAVSEGLSDDDCHSGSTVVRDSSAAKAGADGKLAKKRDLSPFAGGYGVITPRKGSTSGDQSPYSPLNRGRSRTVHVSPSSTARSPFAGASAGVPPASLFDATSPSNVHSAELEGESVQGNQVDDLVDSKTDDDDDASVYSDAGFALQDPRIPSPESIIETLRNVHRKSTLKAAGGSSTSVTPCSPSACHSRISSSSSILFEAYQPSGTDGALIEGDSTSGVLKGDGETDSYAVSPSSTPDTAKEKENPGVKKWIDRFMSKFRWPKKKKDKTVDYITPSLPSESSLDTDTPSLDDDDANNIGLFVPGSQDSAAHKASSLAEPLQSDDSTHQLVTTPVEPLSTATACSVSPFPESASASVAPPTGDSPLKDLAEKNVQNMELLCRICEELVSIDQLEEHSKYCSAYSNMDMKSSSCDERLQKLVSSISNKIERQSNGEANIDEETRCRLAYEVVLLRFFRGVARRVAALEYGDAASLRKCDALYCDLGLALNCQHPDLPNYALSTEAGEPKKQKISSTIHQIGQRVEIVVHDKCKVLKEGLEYGKRRVVGLSSSGGSERTQAKMPSIVEYQSEGSVSSPHSNRHSSSSPSNIRQLEDAVEDVSLHRGKRGKSEPRRMTFQDFEFLKPISRGAYGRVFLARKKKTGDLYAIKVLAKEEVIRKNLVHRVKEERRILSIFARSHDWVVKLFYAFQGKLNLYLVMEYCPGGDLFSLLQRFGVFDESMTKQYAAELVLALEELHARGIVHRDLKPDNVLLDRKGHLKLSDFGLSTIGLYQSSEVDANHFSGAPSSLQSSSAWSTDDHHMTASASPSTDDFTSPFSTSPLMTPNPSFLSSSFVSSTASSSSPLNSFFPANTPSSRSMKRTYNSSHHTFQNGAPGYGKKMTSACGTPDYLAPEIILGRPHSYPVDLYALGILLFECLTGCPPFNDDTPEKIFENALNGEIPWQFCPDEVSKDARDLISALLSRDPAKRPTARVLRNHRFFVGTDWDAIRDQPAPFVPLHEDEEDTANFDARQMLFPVQDDTVEDEDILLPRRLGAFQSQSSSNSLLNGKSDMDERMGEVYLDSPSHIADSKEGSSAQSEMSLKFGPPFPPTPPAAQSSNSNATTLPVSLPIDIKGAPSRRLSRQSGILAEDPAPAPPLDDPLLDRFSDEDMDSEARNEDFDDGQALSNSFVDDFEVMSPNTRSFAGFAFTNTYSLADRNAQLAITSATSASAPSSDKHVSVAKSEPSSPVGSPSKDGKLEILASASRGRSNSGPIVVTHSPSSASSREFFTFDLK